MDSASVWPVLAAVTRGGSLREALSTEQTLMPLWSWPASFMPSTISMVMSWKIQTFWKHIIGLNQVLSLTQLYSFDFSQSRIGVFSTNARSRFVLAVFDGVLGPLRLARQTWLCPCFSVVPKATYEASQGPLKGTVSAEKALQGSETETRELLGGTEEKSISPMRGHWFTLQANQWFFTKKETKKLS